MTSKRVIVILIEYLLMRLIYSKSHNYQTSQTKYMKFGNHISTVAWKEFLMEMSKWSPWKNRRWQEQRKCSLFVRIASWFDGYICVGLDTLFGQSDNTLFDCYWRYNQTQNEKLSITIYNGMQRFENEVCQLDNFHHYFSLYDLSVLQV